MRLREFDLDLIDDDAHRFEFRRQTRCITALYERCFPGLATDKTWKILVECVKSVKHTGSIDLLGVQVTQLRFDWPAWQRAETLKRKKMALAALQEGVMKVVAEKRWPEEPFETAHACVVERNYANEYTWPDKPKASPDRKHKAWLFCVHDMDRFRAWLVIADKSGNELKRELAFEVEPEDHAFDEKMGKLEWKSNRRVVLITKRSGKEAKGLSLPA